MLKKIGTIFFCFIGIGAIAQIPKDALFINTGIFPQETVSLSVNSELLLAGEWIQYKAYVRNPLNKRSHLSSRVYVSLRNETDSVVFSHKLKVENGTANGDFFIPSSLNSGKYRLIGYTNFSRNNVGNALAQTDIYIINTFKKTFPRNNLKDTTTVKFTGSAEIPLSANISKKQAIQIFPNKQSFGFREKVVVVVENNSDFNGGNFVLSVRKKDPILVKDSGIQNKKNQSSEVFFVPELRGELISGVVSRDGEPLANLEVSLTIPGSEFIFKISKTNAHGRFFFSVDEGYETDKSIIQLNVPQMDAESYSIILDSKDFHIGSSPASTLDLDPKLGDWLRERSVQVQIENAYFDVKKDSVFMHPSNPVFYDGLGTLYKLEDYTRFPSVRETFVEIITDAAIRGSERNARFLVYNAYDPNRMAKFNNIPPLVLLDGMQILNNEDLLNYNAREIESIRVVAQPYRYGPGVYSGIISVRTKNGNYSPPNQNHLKKIDLPPLVHNKELYRPDYSNKPVLSRIPDYRVQLLWQPNVKVVNEKYTTSFYTSDVVGVYEIIFEGYTDLGEFVSVKGYFNVID